jgi:hypothetical protein
MEAGRALGSRGLPEIQPALTGTRLPSERAETVAHSPTDCSVSPAPSPGSAIPAPISGLDELRGANDAGLRNI